MTGSATLNVRMDSETKDAFSSFCEEIGMSASSLMNVFAKTVVRNQAVPFLLTTATCQTRDNRYARVFPQTVAELEESLALSEAVGLDGCKSMAQGIKDVEENMGW